MTESDLSHPVTENQPSKICPVCEKVFYKRKEERFACWEKKRRFCSHVCQYIDRATLSTDCTKDQLSKECECGCGQQTQLAPYTRTERGWIKGQPLRFISGHHRLKGPRSFNWAGGVRKDNHGYVQIFDPDNRPDNATSYMREHILIAEKVLGKLLPPKAVIHHFDCKSDNNSNSNIVVCENQNYHMLLHRRTRALIASGHANWRKCQFCKQYDDPTKIYKTKTGGYHRKCASQWQRERRQLKKIKKESICGAY